MPKPIQCILLVDDDPDDNYFHELIIRDSGVCEDVRVAENGYQALHYLTHTDLPDYTQPDVIFLDINMPGMNGFEFLEQYQTLPRDQKSRLLLLMLTTSVNPIDQKRASISSEVSFYYTKPLTTAILHELVETYFC
ncbi:MAG TPA: response regulator [Hymenobacter sp.]|jgi:CheY-like chemotaxis protein|nr:response regulator [Hymenobacter sp.]HLL96655.1 response regulator [Spirosoma sp.]